MKSIRCSLELEEESRVVAKPSTTKGHIKEVKSILEEQSPNIHGVWRWMGQGETPDLEV